MHECFWSDLICIKLYGHIEFYSMIMQFVEKIIILEQLPGTFQVSTGTLGVEKQKEEKDFEVSCSFGDCKCCSINKLRIICKINATKLVLMTFLFDLLQTFFLIGTFTCYLYWQVVLFFFFFFFLDLLLCKRVCAMISNAWICIFDIHFSCDWFENL